MIIAREYQVSETRNPLSVGLAQVSFFGDQPNPARPTARPSLTQPDPAQPSPTQPNLAQPSPTKP